LNARSGTCFSGRRKATWLVTTTSMLGGSSRKMRNASGEPLQHGAGQEADDKGRLGGIGGPARRFAGRSFLDDGDEITQMPQLHADTVPEGYGLDPKKSFPGTPAKPKFQPTAAIS
jgi:hypothetical protein